MKFNKYHLTDNLNFLDSSFEKIVVNTINAHSYVMAEQDSSFKKCLVNADYLVPDGVGICLAYFLSTFKIIHRLTGSDIHNKLIAKAHKENLKVFYLGSNYKTLEKIKSRLANEYPNIVFECFSPPFKSSFSEIENQLIISKINSFKPNILFVGMTAPKQEKWVYKNKNLVDFNLSASIGAVFDFYAGNTKRAPYLFQKIGLEWLHRSFMSKRLAKRNFSSNPKFVLFILKSMFKTKKY